MSAARLQPARRDAAGRRIALGLRVLGAVAGGYAVTALAVAVAGAALARAGMARSEAVVLAAMLGFLAYLALLLWAFHVARVGRLWAALAGAAAALAGALWLLR